MTGAFDRWGGLKILLLAAVCTPIEGWTGA
jgi:hypothetical protein